MITCIAISNIEHPGRATCELILHTSEIIVESVESRPDPAILSNTEDMEERDGGGDAGGCIPVVENVPMDLMPDRCDVFSDPETEANDSLCSICLEPTHKKGEPGVESEGGSDFTLPRAISENFEDNGLAAAPCGHVFHSRCLNLIISHAKENLHAPSCPLCRTNLQPESSIVDIQNRARRNYWNRQRRIFVRAQEQLRRQQQAAAQQRSTPAAHQRARRARLHDLLRSLRFGEHVDQQPELEDLVCGLRRGWLVGIALAVFATALAGAVLITHFMHPK